MHIDKFSFGSIRIDGATYDRDVVIDRGSIRERDKAPSKRLREDFSHTPLSAAEAIPWNCRRLIIGTGAYGNLPVMDDVKREAKRRNVELVILPTTQAIELLQSAVEEDNAILHLTC